MTEQGRLALGIVAVLVIGFSLGVASHVTIPVEGLVALIGAATALLLLAAYRRD